MPRQYPYGEWTRGILRLQDIPGPVAPAAPLGDAERARLCAAFGYAHEDIEDMILPMAVSGVEPTVSMGADDALATLSHAHPPLFAYFKQRFAQVTNPPIDAIREKVKTDESIYIGDDGNLLSPRRENCRVIELDSPILTAEELERIRGLRHPDFRVRVISLLYPRAKTCKAPLRSCSPACDRACREGVNIVILSDRGWTGNTWPSLRCWRCRRWNSTWCAKRSAPPSPCCWRAANRATFTSLPCSSALARGR